VLLVDKPAGVTSHDVVAAVRRALGGLKTGHAGTLDPFATGLLIVLIGAATKSQALFMGLPKRYSVLAQLGVTSTTGDPEGELTRTERLPPDPPALPVGEITQRPPRHSAVKIAGERAYRRARRGESFEMPPRIVTMTRFEQTWREPPPAADADAGPGPERAPLPRAAFEIDCGSGTYVRSLISEIVDAYCLELRRTAIGPFDVGEACAPPARGVPWPEPPVIELERALARVRSSASARPARPPQIGSAGR
jgi:tRNA pseudouridine55 synthase